MEVIGLELALYDMIVLEKQQAISIYFIPFIVPFVEHVLPIESLVLFVWIVFFLEYVSTKAMLHII